MKRAILTTLIAAATSGFITKAHGQGAILFANFDGGSLNAPVTFAMTYTTGGISGVAGEKVGSEFSADLLYSLDGGASYNFLTQTAAGAGSSYPTAFSGTDGNDASGAGYFIGPAVSIPGYSSGSITFIVRAYSGPTFANSAWFGESAPFTMSSISTGTESLSHFSGLAPFNVVWFIPEPSTFALAGLGAAGLIAFRRKKA